jgi:poly(3-hydroxybutyrate) depolymerase
LINMKRRNWWKLGWLPVLLVCMAATTQAASPSAVEMRRSFEVADIERTRRVAVHIYIPTSVTRRSSILVVMHGNGRNAENYHEVWQPIASANGAILVTPEFSKDEWPRSRHYHQGNIQTVRNATKPWNVWSFTAMEKAVEIAAGVAGVSGKKFYLYGHSAGAQFVHRYVMVTGGARLIRAVAANAGWYSWPSKTKAYPYGVALIDNHRWDWKTVFRTGLTILVGADDNDPEAKSLRRSAKVMFQGEHRLARGSGFFRAARALADTSGAAFHWRFATVPNVGHSNHDMAKAAARILFPQ